MSREDAPKVPGPQWCRRSQAWSPAHRPPPLLGAGGADSGGTKLKRAGGEVEEKVTWGGLKETAGGRGASALENVGCLKWSASWVASAAAGVLQGARDRRGEGSCPDF